LSILKTSLLYIIIVIAFIFYNLLYITIRVLLALVPLLHPHRLLRGMRDDLHLQRRSQSATASIVSQWFRWIEGIHRCILFPSRCRMRHLSIQWRSTSWTVCLIKNELMVNGKHSNTFTYLCFVRQWCWGRVCWIPMLRILPKWSIERFDISRTLNLKLIKKISNNLYTTLTKLFCLMSRCFWWRFWRCCIQVVWNLFN